MYYAHGGDSLNFSCGHQEGGSSVLIKSGYPNSNDPSVLQKMRELNPTASGTPNRPLDKLCNGQTRISEIMSCKELANLFQTSCKYGKYVFNKITQENSIDRVISIEVPGMFLPNFLS